MLSLRLWCKTRLRTKLLKGRIKYELLALRCLAVLLMNLAPWSGFSGVSHLRFFSVLRFILIYKLGFLKSLKCEFKFSTRYLVRDHYRWFAKLAVGYQFHQHVNNSIHLLFTLRETHNWFKLPFTVTIKCIFTKACAHAHKYTPWNSQLHLAFQIN